MNTWRTLMLAILTVAVLAATAPAQETFDEKVDAGQWGAEATIGANMLQSYYTDNWNGGDVGSIVWNATLDARAVKQVAASWRWHNTLNLAFGQNHQQERTGDETIWRKPDKTDDRFDAESILRNNKSAWGPFAGVRFQSLFLDQSDWRGDFTMNPMEFFETVGVSRALVDTEEQKFFVRLGATAHQMIRDIYLDSADPDLPETMDPQNETATDMGAELVFDYVNTKLTTNVEFTSQLRMYWPLAYSGKSDFEDLGEAYLEAAGLPGDIADYTVAPDIDWDNTFKANITSVINVQLNLRWVYDKYDNTVAPVVQEGDLLNAAAVSGSIRKAGQFKQTLSLGLGYTF